MQILLQYILILLRLAIAQFIFSCQLSCFSPPFAARLSHIDIDFRLPQHLCAHNCHPPGTAPSQRIETTRAEDYVEIREQQPWQQHKNTWRYDFLSTEMLTGMSRIIFYRVAVDWLLVRASSIAALVFYRAIPYIV